MAASRPHWKGYLKLSLVSCPVALYPGTSSSERVSFRQINKATGNRLRQQLIDEVTREVVDAADKGRGYEVAKNTFLPIEDEELDAIAIESSHTIEIDSFVPRAQIDQRFLDSPYYIAPNDKVGQEAFAVIREAMRGKDMVALARIVLAKRERVVMLEPWDRGLLATTLRYPYEIREAGDVFGDIPDIKVEGEMLKLAEHILDTKAADFDPATFVDHYEQAVVDMIDRKKAGMPAVTEKPVAPAANVVSLMEALKRSVAAETKGEPKPARRKKGSAAKQEEIRKAPQFKFAIKGGKDKEAQPAAAPKRAPKRKSA